MTCSLFISPTMKMRKKKQAEGNRKWQLKKKENSLEKNMLTMHETQSFWEKKNRQAQDSPPGTTNILPKRQGNWGSKRSLFLLDNVANHICSGNK